MLSKSVLISSVVIIYLCWGVFEIHSFRYRRLGNLQLKEKAIDNAIDLIIESDGKPALSGHLGLALPEAVGQSTASCNPGDSDECLEWGDFARLYLTSATDSNDHCATIEWYSPFARRLEDCYDLEEGVHWYGGGGPAYYHTWPIEIVSRKESPMIAGDSLGGYEYGGVTESYWLVSSGVAIHVDEEVALHMSMNSSQPNKVCFVAEDKYPFKQRGEVRLKYQICTGKAGENFKDVHQRALHKFYDKPTDFPLEQVLLKPFWSTWAEYKTEVNQTLVLELANRLVAEGFGKSSHIEIDDDWETCYGEAEFNPTKFPDPAAMTATLKTMGFATTLWIHPFINMDCSSFATAEFFGYFVKDEKSMTGLVRWWQGRSAGLIDFTNPTAVEWWSMRLDLLRTVYGIDSFKFDAGESTWMPHSFQITGDSNNTPNLYTTKFVEAVSAFGRMLEVRVGRKNQKEPIFTRMLDKDSRWGYDNGLQSLIPTLLDFSIKGYSFVLPDMIGGNAYGARPSKELYIRWMQANSFMPAVQFSLLPWNYDEETVSIVKEILALREEYGDNIIRAAQQSVDDGSPINRPMWWVDPTDSNTFAIDNQYMLGDDILVAPVLVEGAVSRDIYLPKGVWKMGTDDTTYEGPINLQNFDVPLNRLPFFVRQP